MAEPNWPKLVGEAIFRLEKDDSVFPAASYLKVIDDVVAGLGPNVIDESNNFTSDHIGTALGHVTTSIQGEGKIRPLSEGGWYERVGDKYVVTLGFAEAWKVARTSKKA